MQVTSRAAASCIPTAGITVFGPLRRSVQLDQRRACWAPPTYDDNCFWHAIQHAATCQHQAYEASVTAVISLRLDDKFKELLLIGRCDNGCSSLILGASTLINAPTQLVNSVCIVSAHHNLRLVGEAAGKELRGLQAGAVHQCGQMSQGSQPPLGAVPAGVQHLQN
jgi:hypothetical protein